KPKKKRIRRSETSSTAFQRRKKAEVAALRSEVQMLETHLCRLKKQEEAARRNVLDGDSKAFTWATKAATEYFSRTQAEKLNRKLKALWEGQRDVSESLRAV
ncbi:hypothetical protein PHYSODRAFT_457577, partial [Phytophthora sojae]